MEPNASCQYMDDNRYYPDDRGGDMEEVTLVDNFLHNLVGVLDWVVGIYYFITLNFNIQHLLTILLIKVVYTQHKMFKQTNRRRERDDDSENAED